MNSSRIHSSCWIQFWEIAQILESPNDSRMSPDLPRGTSKSIGGDLNVDDEGYEQRRFKTRAVTTPWLCWLPTRAHTNWPRQEGYVPASESRTQARIEKNNLELQMND
jgi:hypothetical protein